MKIPVTFMGKQEFNAAVPNGLCVMLDESSEPPDFADNELALIDKLESILVSKYGEEHAFVEDNIWPEHSLTTWISASIFDKELIMLFLDFLSSHSQHHCIITSVEAPALRARGAQNVGRMALNLQEIAVESTLQPLWDRQVGDIEFP